jgi:hypothetical protein
VGYAALVANNDDELVDANTPGNGRTLLSALETIETCSWEKGPNLGW